MHNKLVNWWQKSLRERQVKMFVEEQMLEFTEDLLNISKDNQTLNICTTDSFLQIKLAYA